MIHQHSSSFCKLYTTRIFVRQKMMFAQWINMSNFFSIQINYKFYFILLDFDSTLVFWQDFIFVWIKSPWEALFSVLELRKYSFCSCQSSVLAAGKRQKRLRSCQECQPGKQGHTQFSFQLTTFPSAAVLPQLLQKIAFKPQLWRMIIT